jgi:tetratricopeptide (TPR) repeat protein
MNKEPSRRYGSVLELSEDLRRYQTGLPVAARRDTFSYRAVKFINRNRVGVAAVGVIVATIVFALFAMNDAARRERAARKESDRHLLMNIEQLVALKKEINAGDRLRGLLSSSLSMLEVSDERSIESLLEAVLKQLEAGQTEAPRNEAAVRMLIGSMYRAIGRFDDAETNLNRAMEIRLALSGAEDHPELAKVFHELGLVFTDMGDHTMAKNTHQCALDMRKRLIGEGDDSDIAASYVFLSESLSASGEFAEAEKAAREGLRIYLSVLSSSDSSTLRAHYYLGVALMGRHQYNEAGKHLNAAYRGLEHIFGPEHLRVRRAKETIQELKRRATGQNSS